MLIQMPRLLGMAEVSLISLQPFSSPSTAPSLSRCCFSGNFEGSLFCLTGWSTLPWSHFCPGTLSLNGWLSVWSHTSWAFSDGIRWCLSGFGSCALLLYMGHSGLEKAVLKTRPTPAVLDWLSDITSSLFAERVILSPLLYAKRSGLRNPGFSASLVLCVP